MLKRVHDIRREIRRAGAGAVGGEFYLGDATRLADELSDTYAGRVSLVYFDPPFGTGDRFQARVRVGEAEWASGRGSLLYNAYSDDMPRAEYLRMLKTALIGARNLMAEDALIFLHVDWRAHPYARLMMDEIFGEGNFLNEIIWAYRSGGRSRKYFPRKHDVILLYAKSPAYDFHIDDVAEPAPGGRMNHMKRHVDADGRVYRSVKSGGRVYTYYDDEPVTPGDVWTDVSHLQQKDPQRTGYDTQKPLRLLERIIKCASRPGDIVMDLFAGSGTTLEAAAMCGRAFLGADINRLSMQTVRRRLKNCACEYVYALSEGRPECLARMERGVAFARVTLEKFALEAGALERELSGLDAVDSWAAGYARGGDFYAYGEEIRTRQNARIKGEIEVPVYEGRPAIRVSDVTGRDFMYYLDTP